MFDLPALVVLRGLYFSLFPFKFLHALHKYAMVLQVFNSFLAIVTETILQIRERNDKPTNYHKRQSCVLLQLFHFVRARKATLAKISK